MSSCGFPQRPRPNMIRVGIVDDEQIARLAIQHMIDWTTGEFEFAWAASDGLTALQDLDRSPADILVVDLKMPRMDGLEFLAALQGRPRIPSVLVLSNFGDFESVREAFRRGAKDYLMKTDISPELLMRSLWNLASAFGMDFRKNDPIRKFLLRAEGGAERLEQSYLSAAEQRNVAFAFLAVQAVGEGGGDLVRVIQALAEQG
ncbi:MAG: response regulator, partial [Spirochaetaceae bacterium]|nr:response regulator [Spirochaetaceae bacterium]